MKRNACDLTYEEKVEILTWDHCTTSEAKKHLKDGAVIFDDLYDVFVFLNYFDIRGFLIN